MLAHPGMADFNKRTWHDDQLMELHHNDALWGFNVHVAEELCLWGNDIDNLTLRCLFHMGAYDWHSPDNRMATATQGIQFTNAMGSRLFHRIRSVEGQVRRCRLGLVLRLTGVVVVASER